MIFLYFIVRFADFGKEVSFMDAAALLFLFCAFLFGIISLCLFAVFLGIAAVTKNKSLVKGAFIILGSYIGVLAVCILIHIGVGIYYDNLPELSVRENRVTVLDSGSSSLGSSSAYICSKEGILTLVDTPRHSHHMSEKYGFTFEAAAPGEVYLLVADYGHSSIYHMDIYKIIVSDDYSVSAVHVEKITPDRQQDTIEHAVSAYGFSYEELLALF